MNSPQTEIKIDPPVAGERLVLHACCGPCSLQPFKILRDAGWDITIMYSNSNIYPEAEFDRRFDTLETWANENNITLIKDNYDEDEWAARVKPLGEAPQNTPERQARCGECYKLRLEHAAKFAKATDVKYLSSTLAVSPYQYYEELKAQLDAVCKEYFLNPVLMDFRPFYSQATQESRDAGMYRQKYCGCEFSYRESMDQFQKNGNEKYLRELLSITRS